jgi:ABC-type transport system involved in Fe-S cluster assembly fused permease/ATPase subunit
VIAGFSTLIDRQVMRKFMYVARSMTVAEETLAAVRTVRGFNRESMETARFMHETKKVERQDIQIGRLVHGMFAIVITTLWILIIGSMSWGGRMVLSGELEPGDLFAAFGMLLFNNFALIELQTSLQAEQKAVASGGRILDYTERQASLNFSGGTRIKNFKGHIEFRNVSFKYPTREVCVLKNVSFTIEPGQMGALVGHSGSGKSTCVQLLERFYDVTDGVILLDGHDIKTLEPRWLHHKIALVAQEPILFQMTIRENVKYGKRKATDEEVDAAIEIANAKKFIVKMEKGLDTVVGEKGSTLSGGQRQRIAIARAVIRDPAILMTDEATSALDAASEKRVQLALDKVMEGRTAVVVAHRLSTIRNASIIYVFDTGEIKEQGTHEELIAKKEWYYELVKRQLTDSDKKLLGVEDEELIAPPDIGPQAAKTTKNESGSSSEEEPAPAKTPAPPKPPSQENEGSRDASSSREKVVPTGKPPEKEESSESTSDEKIQPPDKSPAPAPAPPKKESGSSSSDGSSSHEKVPAAVKPPAQAPPPPTADKPSSSDSSDTSSTDAGETTTEETTTTTTTTESDSETTESTSS